MKVKGVAVKTLPKYLLLKYPDVYDNWLRELPQNVRQEYINGIYVSRWYDVDAYLRQPLLTAARLAFVEPKQMAWDMGIFSAQDALNGVYRFFLRFGGPANMIRRTPFFLETYYSPANIKLDLLDKDRKYAELYFYDFVNIEDVIIHRIGGWGYYTLLASGSNEAKIDLEDAGEKDVRMIIQWD